MRKDANISNDYSLGHANRFSQRSIEFWRLKNCEQRDGQIGQQMTELLKGLLLTERSNKIGKLVLLIMGANSFRTSVLCTSKCFSRPYIHGFAPGPYNNKNYPTTLSNNL